MDFDSQELKQHIKALKEIDFELAYLALLTCEGLKPLSRWEKPLDGHGFGLLQQIGLLTKQIRRTVKTGKEVLENIFGTSAGYIQLYEKRFAGTPIDKSAQTIRFEGFLFGFPPCCVDEYIRHPYAKNNLNSEDQKILFHWACKDCKITPLILPACKSIYNSLKDY
ncbi:MAG: hypothetical protein PHQ35_05510 [Phycisphaerae bacterium]|nr:hypothetical protein [Phycisphaerae bacterium]MDD5380827.1 hypothetical protein [Phycisphaerae bacterium]